MADPAPVQMVAVTETTTTTTSSKAGGATGSCCGDFFTNAFGRLTDAIMPPPNPANIKLLFDFNPSDTQAALRFAINFYFWTYVVVAILSIVFGVIGGYSMIGVGVQGVLSALISSYCWSWAGVVGTWQNGPKTCDNFPCCGVNGWLLTMVICGAINGVLMALTALDTLAWIEYSIVYLIVVILYFVMAAITLLLAFFGYKHYAMRNNGNASADANV